MALPGRRSAQEIDWTFGGLWPHEPSWFDTPDGRLHYVDVGPRDGKPVVLLHGNPTWGFLYRNFIGPLADAGYRAIVPDLLGFGRSDKPARPELYTIEQHALRTEALLESLDLHGATIVPQDWGGPISMYWAVKHPERVSGLFILNTAAHVLREKFEIPMVLRLFRAPGVGELMVKGMKMFHHGFVFRAGIDKPERLTPAVKRAYLTPHAAWSDCTGVLVFPRVIPVDPAEEPWASFGAMLETGFEALRDRPVHLAWGMKDPSFGAEMIDDMWLQTFPKATVTRIADASHYLQEDAYEQIVPELLEFVARLP